MAKLLEQFLEHWGSLSKEERRREYEELKEYNSFGTLVKDLVTLGDYTWNKESEHSIYDAINDWGYHKFACIMKDGTLQEFSGIYDETYDGEINLHVDHIGDVYSTDDIVMWIEIPIER